VIISLFNRSLIQVNGKDAQTFLQSQFTNDISRCKNFEVQFNAYCQHQGKVIGVIWLFIYDGSYFLSFPKELQSEVLTKLEMYRMMSDVKFVDVSSEYFTYAIIDEEFPKKFKLKNKLSIAISQEKISTADFSFWEKECIENLIPEIYSHTSLKYTPESLNLDIDEFGLSFSKGCYPGQEVVARMHYLGKPKRRLLHFISEYEAFVGDSINSNGSKSLKPSGEIIRVGKIGKKYHFLGTFEVAHINDTIFLQNDMNKSLTVINAETYIP